MDHIRVSVDVTKNLGDYNSLKVGASFETDVLPQETEAEAYDRAWALVEKQIETKLAEAEID